MNIKNGLFRLVPTKVNQPPLPYTMHVHTVGQLSVELFPLLCSDRPQRPHMNRVHIPGGPQILPLLLLPIQVGGAGANAGVNGRLGRQELQGGRRQEVSQRQVAAVVALHSASRRRLAAAQAETLPHGLERGCLALEDGLTVVDIVQESVGRRQVEEVARGRAARLSQPFQHGVGAACVRPEHYLRQLLRAAQQKGHD